jgi:RecB family exonuclease
VITPRATRLVRVPDLRAFRDAATALACEGDPLAARDRLLVVPTRAAASHLAAAIERRMLRAHAAVVLPELVTREELYDRLASRLADRPRILNGFERETLLGAACRAAEAAGTPAPFRLRPALIAEILAFYDDLRRHEQDVGGFERKALDALEPGAESDRGAERLVRQTRFLVAAFRELEARCAAAGAVDEHALRERLRQTASPRPWKHLVITVRDRATDPDGLWNCDFDLAARMPGLERIDLVVTDTSLAGALHERLHGLFPGIEEHRWPVDDAQGGPDGCGRQEPALLLPPRTGIAHAARDREEEVAEFAWRVRGSANEAAAPPLERIALVVRRPLPYVYVAREVLRSAGVPCQMFDALPLAAEPYAAALDLVFTCVSSNFTRAALAGLLRSPHFRFEHDGEPIAAHHVARLDRALSDAGYLGDVAALGSIPAAAPALGVARELLPLREPAPVAGHLDVLLAFLARHETVPGPDGPLRARQLRARAAVVGALRAIRDAHAAFDPAPGGFDRVAAMVRRWIEVQTFAPRAGDTGVQLVDAASAPYGDFDEVQLAGLVDGEWPDRPRRSIFYSAALLRALGWPGDRERLDGARNAFLDLLRLPSRRLVVSTFTLEDDALVSASPFVDDVAAAGLPTLDPSSRGLSGPRATRLPADAAGWAAFRLDTPAGGAGRHRGATAGHAAPAFPVSALERYQDCPFKFFAADVLRLEEAPEDEPSLSPRARGRFIHEVFQRFFEAWERQGPSTITPDRVDAARALFEEVAAPLLARLPEAEAALERTRLFGSAVAVGLVDVVLGIEASREATVVERLLEQRLDGEFSLGSGERRAPLRGVADRIDLLEGRRLRVIDYKSGHAPNVRRALQVPVYAMCAAERLEARDGQPWQVDEAAYVAFSGTRALVPVVKPGTPDPSSVLHAARDRAFAALDAIARGEFPPRPHDPSICGWCAYAPVCRKDYVGED